MGADLQRERRAAIEAQVAEARAATSITDMIRLRGYTTGDVEWLLSRLRDLESEWDRLLALVDDACASDDLTALRDWQTSRLLKETQQ